VKPLLLQFELFELVSQIDSKPAIMKAHNFFFSIVGTPDESGNLDRNKQVIQLRTTRRESYGDMQGCSSKIRNLGKGR
jgi:hypothetical protein